MKHLPVAGPWITDLEIGYVTEAVTSAWYEEAGMFHDRFERAFSEHLGVKHVMALPSCTSALHLALAGLGIGAGDEVIVPDITWIATAAPITYVGAQTVFADVDPVTWCLTADSVEACLTERTRAVIAVDLYGGMPDMDGLTALLESRGVPLIEDAAQAIGGMYHGRRAGSFGQASVFSFHGSKTLTTGEGGLLATNDSALFTRVSVLRDHGRIPGPKLFWNGEVGFKYRMSSMQAALGLAQLERIDELVERKRWIFQQYHDRLGSVDAVTINAQPHGTLNSYWMVTAAWEPDRGLPKERVMAALSGHGIDSRPFFYPLSSLPAYESAPDRARAQGVNTHAYRISPNAINLPSAFSLVEEDIDRVCTTFSSVMREL